MFHFLLLFHIIASVAARSRFNFDEEIFPEFSEDVMNDPNLNPGFDLEAFRINQLDLHNYYRSKHGVPLMSRDETLTNQAQAYAEALAAEDKGLIHCGEDNAIGGCTLQGAGENLARAFGNVNAETNATKAWYDEIWDYNFCFEEGANAQTRPGHEGKPIGHFTQVVWEASRRLGIGYARTSDRTGVYVVARYLPAGNFRGQYSENVKKPDFILETFQDNCNGTNGGLSDWMGPGECSRSCGGGVQFLTKTCTNPKPSLNGADCAGETKQLVREWCNTQSCPGNEDDRNQQCAARGFAGESGIFRNFGECRLFCRRTPRVGDFFAAGNVDDGTHCNSDTGACVDGVCQNMPLYVAGTPPPPPPPRPDTTTKEPNNSTEEPETTTPEPETTTLEPETTTPEPETTTPEPETTTPEPETTTPEPETTTPEPETTTPEPETTTPEPETTTIEPNNTTMKPETNTTAVPNTTTPNPETTTNTPSPTPTRRLFRGFLRRQVAPGTRVPFLTIPSGSFFIYILNFNPRLTLLRYRYQKTGNEDVNIPWRVTRCRSRCRMRGPVAAGYDIQLEVLARRCRRCRRFRRRLRCRPCSSVRISLFWRYFRNI